MFPDEFMTRSKLACSYQLCQLGEIKRGGSIIISVVKQTAPLVVKKMSNADQIMFSLLGGFFRDFPGCLSRPHLQVVHRRAFLLL